jgi:hypothetical protein
MTTREEDRAAWWEVFSAAIVERGYTIYVGDAETRDGLVRSVNYAGRLADAALAASKARWPEEESPI